MKPKVGDILKNKRNGMHYFILKERKEPGFINEFYDYLVLEMGSYGGETLSFFREFRRVA